MSAVGVARVAVIGAGPAGLMAAEVLQAAGVSVDVFDAMPSVGRKFLLAGRGGLNLTHTEPLTSFLDRYGARREVLAPMVQAFAPQAVRAWAAGLGVETFVGSSGRIFPVSMKASPLLRAWLHRLREPGPLGAVVRFHLRHRWLGWAPDGALRFATPVGEGVWQAEATVLALGGASWPRLGSTGAWVPWLRERQIDVAPLRPANCGFDVAPTAPGRSGWSEHLSSRFAGAPLKAVAVRWADADGRMHHKPGECVLTATGIEGGLIYACAAAVRDAIEAQGGATIELDLLPALSAERVAADVAHPRGSRSWSSHLKSRLGLHGAKMALLHELLPASVWADPAALARSIKTLPLRLQAPRPIDEAISTAGGVRFEALNEQLMLRALPGVFCAGEMLDWEAPTGGYLLTACLASGRAAGHGVRQWLPAQA